MESNNFMNRDAEKPKEFCDRKQREAQELEALKAKLISVLEKSDQQDKLRTSRKNAAGKSVTVIHIASPLFSTLRTCLQHLNYLSCAHILKCLMKNVQCNMDFILHLITVILEKDSSQSSTLNNFLSTFNNLHNTCRDEVRLLQLIHHLNCGDFKDALSVVSKANDLQWSRFKRNTLAPEIAFNLLSGYKTVLQYMESNSSDSGTEGHYLESFQALTTENCFLPIFAENYTQLLLKSSEPVQAEEFIRKFVECESKNSGLLAPLQALSIVKLHMSKNQKLISDLLQAVAEKDSGHPLVLELCWKHLRNNVKKKAHHHASSDSDIDSGENSDDVSRSQPENLNKCLSLIFNFLDTNFNNCQAWSILSENLRSICLLGSKECATAVVDLWHKSEWRRSWWLDESFCLRSRPQPAPIDLLVNKAISCFILEDASHSFVQHVLSLSNTAQLTIIMNQLKKAKSRLDTLIKTTLIPVSCPSNAPTASASQPISKREVEIRKLFLEYLKSSRVKTELNAESYSGLASSNTVREIHGVPIKKFDENFYWDLPVYQRFKNRLEKRDEERQEAFRKAKRSQNAKRSGKRTKIPKPHVSSSENDSEDEMIAELIHGHQEKRADTEVVFARPATPVESDSPLPPASFPCPTPDLQFASTPAPKETICIEERYRFFDCDSLSSDADITDMNVANLETEPLLPVQKSAEDERSEEKSTKESAQMSSACTSTTCRFEASSPDIFRPECDRLSEEFHQQSPSVSEDHQPNPEECCETSKSITSKKGKKRTGKRKTKKSQRSLSDICRQVVDSAIHEQAASESISEQRDEVTSSNAHSETQESHEDREALIAELLENVHRIVSGSSHQKRKMKKQKKSRKTKTKKKKFREDIIAELLRILTKTLQLEPTEAASSKRQSRRTPICKKQKLVVVTGTNSADEREEIIAELLNTQRKSLDGPMNSPKVGKTNANEEDDDIPTGAEEQKIQMDIESVVRKSQSIASSVKSDDHNDGIGAALNSRSTKRKLSQLVDQSTDARKSKQRIEMWLEQVVIQNAEVQQETEKSSKRARYQDRSPKKSPKEKQLASHSAASTSVDRVLLSPNPKAQSTSKESKNACHVDVNFPVKRKKLFTKVGNFLDLTYRSKRT